jgi:hypothetical protein
MKRHDIDVLYINYDASLSLEIRGFRWSGHERALLRGQAGGRPEGEQPGREQPPPVSTKEASDAPLSQDEVLAAWATEQEFGRLGIGRASVCRTLARIPSYITGQVICIDGGTTMRA